MDKIIANNRVNLCDRLANRVANAVTSECIKILGEIPSINRSDLIIDKVMVIAYNRNYTYIQPLKIIICEKYVITWKIFIKEW